MKKFNVFVATIALLAATTAASAVDTAWFSLEGGTVLNSSQGPGAALVIEKNLDTVTLTIGYNVSSGSGALAGWAIAITSQQTPGKSVSVDGFTRLGAGYNIPTGGNAPVSLSGGGTFDIGAGAINADGTTGLVFTFELTIDGKTDQSTTDIFGSFGTSEQVRSDGVQWYGTVGPNAGSGGLGDPVGVVYGYAGTSFGSLPVISITNIPEPATLALLGLGVVALIRRRR